MRIVLWAFHEAGYRAVRQLHGGGHDLLVFTGEQPAYIPSVDDLAGTLGIPVYTATTEAKMQEKVQSFVPDLGISMYYPHILPMEVIRLPHMGSFNFHPSLLPRHRGCFSAPWAILEGDTETGVTSHEMVGKVDSGRILCQSRVPITATDTAFSLYYKLVDSAMVLLGDAMTSLQGGPVRLAEQDIGGCYHPREVPFMGKIDTSWSVEQVDRFIRAMYFPPHQSAQVFVGDDICSVNSLDEYLSLENPGG